MNEHGNTITTSLVDGTTIVWILGGCLRGHLEGWRPCRPEERSAGTIQAEKAESDYWRTPPTPASSYRC